MAYSEHVGVNLQAGGNIGESVRLYNRRSAIKNLFIFTVQRFPASGQKLR